ncbi:MAG: energy-coupled thiamine transporter ThiT [Oscillospiraceae bacterium]|nr:energy-coupled thiamine transporter ThiT [Oscillospiraceae bacterium]
MQNTKTKTLVECAVMVALATVLSYIKIYRLPWGGSITLLSMLPVIVFSIRHGIKWGLACSGLNALLQLGQGIIGGLFGWGLTPAMLIGCILLDYLLPYFVLGFSGMFRNKGQYGWIAGMITTILIRIVFHVLSGVVIWESAGELWSGFSTDNSVIYSLLYNCAYMLPEMIFTIIGAIALFNIPQTAKFFPHDKSGTPAYNG